MAHERRRVRAVDALRGIAMLGVIAIQARPTFDWSLHTLLIGRSVPIFLVLVGVSAELWRQKHDDLTGRRLAGAYLAATGRRLLVPYWTWLLCLLGIAAVASRLPGTAGMWFLAPLGYVPWAGPSWVITAIALLSFAIPALHWLAARIGLFSLAAAALLVTLWSHHNALAIMDAGRELLPLPPGKGPLYLFRIFVPAYFWHVAGGLWLGRRRAHVDAPLFCVSALALIWGHWWLALPGLSQNDINALAAVLDVPLTFVALALMQGLYRVPLFGSALALVGRASWGVYLGHLLLFVGCGFFGRNYHFDSRTRLGFFAVLLVGGLVLTGIGYGLRILVGRRVPLLSARGSLERV